MNTMANFVTPDYVLNIKTARDSAYKIDEIQYDDIDGRTVRKESIILMFMRTIFQSTIKKMELAMALPSLISNPELHIIFSLDEISVINDLLSNIEFYSNYSPQSVPTDKKSTTKAHSNKNLYNMTRFDYAVYKTLKILYKHIDVLRTKPHYKDISMASASFLHYLHYLLDYVLYRLCLTPEQARNKELHYRKLWRCQKKSIEDIDMYITDLERQRTNHKKMLEDVARRYKKNVATINKINKKCKKDIANTTNKYERKQLALYKEWEFEQNEIQAALGNVIDDFNSLKNINTALEQTICEQKSMTESKLLAVLAKYDTEIGNRHKTLEELNEIYECNKLEKLALEKEMQQQEEVYLAWIKQRLAFKRERAVKTIQKWWRKFRIEKQNKQIDENVQF